MILITITKSIIADPDNYLKYSNNITKKLK